MSNQSSPHQGPAAQADDSQLPSGQCRYILLHPDIKGQRCACVTFTLNKATPNASCACGHLACFHVQTTEPITDAQEFEQLKQRMQEMEREREQLRQRVELLEGRLDRDREIVARVSELEEVVDRSKEEVSQEIKASYRNLNRAWQSITELERQNKAHNERFHIVDGHLHQIDAEQERLGKRQIELVDAEIAMEVRLDDLEAAQNSRLTHGRRRRRSTSDSMATSSSPAPLSRRRRSSESLATVPVPRSGPTSAPMTTVMPLRSAPSPGALWTVHISLMPTASQPFPFERYTNAYNRCLSRGLHQMVAVNGLDAESFRAAVTRAFGNLLQGRPWMPLQALPCTAEQLVGLPMIRPLDPLLIHGRYDADFLRRHCAVRDANGNMDSLYIALTSESLSWHFLRHAPVLVEGLEDSWLYEELLDSNDTLDADDEADGVPRRSAGDIMSLNSLKRAASEMSRSSSFGSAAAAAEGEGSRPKVPRVCPLPNIVEVRKGVKSS